MRIVLVAISAAALAACSGDPQGASTDVSQPAAGVAAADAEEPVAAVQQSQGPAVAQLQFVLARAPVAGVPFTLKLLVQAPEPVPALMLAAESAALTVDAAGASRVLALTEAGVAATHELTLTATAAGLAEVTVRLRAGADQPEAVYVIPVLVLASAPAAPAG